MGKYFSNGHVTHNLPNHDAHAVRVIKAAEAAFFSPSVAPVMDVVPPVLLPLKVEMAPEVTATVSMDTEASVLAPDLFEDKTPVPQPVEPVEAKEEPVSEDKEDKKESKPGKKKK